MNPFPKAFGFNRLADKLRVAPSRLSVDRTITLIRPLAETTLFDRPREPVVKSLRKGPKGLGLGREVWVVFETVSYPEKEWGGMDGYLDCSVVVTRTRSGVSTTSSGSMLSLPRPPARRRTGRPLDASISYPPLTPASNTMGKTVDDIPNLPPGAGYNLYNLSNLSNLSNPNPSVSLPKKGKDDSRRGRDRPSFGLPHDPHPFPNSKNVDRQEDKVREKTDEPLLSVPNASRQQPKGDGDSKNEEGEDDIISAYEYGDSEKSDQKGTSTGRRANENGDNEEDVERVVIERESDDGQNVDGEEGRSDNGCGRESEKESISAALLNNHPSQDEAADEGEEQRERAVESENGEQEERALTTKESSKKKRKQRHKNRHEHTHRSFAHSSKEKKRHDKEDGWFEVAFEGLPFGPDVPGVSQNTIYYSSTRRAELRSSGS